MNLRSSTSCCNCIFNSGGYTSIKCDKGPISRATYSSEFVCDFHKKMFCCDTLKAFSNEACEDDCIIERKEDKFLLKAKKIIMQISYCPWCGEKISQTSKDQ